MVIALLPWLLLTIAGIDPPAQSTGATESRVEIASGEWILVGTLRVPAGGGPWPAVLLLNGAARDRRAYGPLATELANRGIVSLRLDLRGEGESTNLTRFDPARPDPRLEGSEQDVVRALRWLASDSRVDSTHIGVVGASYSGELMAEAARRGSPAAAYVALSPGSFSDASARAIDASNLPWWLIASADERFAQRVVARVSSVSRTARTTIVPGTAHASDILSPHFMLNAEIADWFDARLRRRQAPALWGTLEPGHYPIGWRTVEASGATPVRVDVWYPATGSPADPVRYTDYFATADDLRGIAPGDLRAPASRGNALAVAIGGAKADTIPRVTLETILQSTMLARRDAPADSGRHPLVLWAPRYATGAMQAVLCEFLASHGFVVAVPRPLDGRVLLPFEAETTASKRAELDARVNDMRSAQRVVAAAFPVDTARIGVLAWSYSGEIATAYQRDEPTVSLVAGLSTTLVNDWVYGDAAALSVADPKLASATYAVFAESRAGRVRPPRLEAMSAAYDIEIQGASHGSFNALEGYIPTLAGIAAVQPWSQSGPPSELAYRASATILLRLLRHHVAAANRDALRPAMVVAALPQGRVIAWSSALK